MHLELERDLYGKPFLPRHPDFHFNISHAGQWIVCAFSSDRIGVDIEHCKQISMEIADRFFTPSEYKGIMKLPPHEQQLAFYKIWTQKESYIKAIGKGLTIPLNSIQAIPAGEQRWFIASEHEQQLITRQVSIGSPDYLCCVCSFEDRFPYSVLRFDAEQLLVKFVRLSLNLNPS